MAAVGAVGFAIFGAAFSSHTALGDAPEYTAAVRTLGNVHAPGYPAYVLAGRLFTAVDPFGSWSTRVNWFSVVCATTSVVLLYRLARLCSASVAGSCIGALALATSASFWFNAGFAKHYAFIGAVQLGAVVLVVSWAQRPRSWRLVAAATLLGIGAGAGWQLTAVTLVAVLVFMLVGKTPVAPRVVVTSVAALVIAAAVPWLFEMVRAGQHPLLNWGEPTSLHRLIELVTQKDFHVKAAPKTGFADVSEWPSRARSFLAVTSRDVGPLAVIVGALGAVEAARRRDRSHFALLMALFFVNIGAAVFGAWNIAYGDRGFEPVLVNDGYVIDAVIATAVLVALGVTAAVSAVAPEPNRKRRRKEPHSKAGTALLVVMAAVLILPSLVVHYRYANHRGPALADRYAQRVLNTLPPHAVIIAWGTEYAAPLEYRQVVEHERSDVEVVSGPELTLGWYRDQVARRLNIPLRDDGGSDVNATIADFVRAVGDRRKIYLDADAMNALRGTVRYRTLGLIAVVDRSPSESVADIDRAAAALYASDRADGLRSTDDVKFPNDSVFYFHELGHVELAKQYAALNRLDAAAVELDRAADVWPYNASTLRAIAQLAAQQDPTAQSRIAAL
jgi:hypothetical protein